MSKPLSFYEAGLTLKFVGQQMMDDNVFAGAALDFECCPGLRRDLALFLSEEGVEEARAVEISDTVTLKALIGLDLVED